MSVGGGDHPERQRVESEFLIEFHTDLQSLAGEACLKRASGFLSGLARGQNLTEGTFFVGGSHAQRTFRGALHLIHFGQRLASFAQPPVFDVVGLSIPGIAAVEQPPSLVHIMRNRQEVAGLGAGFLQPTPELESIIDVERRDRVFG